MPGMVCKGKQVCNESSQVYDAGVLCVKTSVKPGVLCVGPGSVECMCVVCKADVLCIR